MSRGNFVTYVLGSDLTVPLLNNWEFARLTSMHIMCIIVHMRTTLNIDSDLLREAGKLTGISEKTSLVRLGLKALVEREAAKRLATLGGTEKSLMQIPRRRIKKIA